MSGRSTFLSGHVMEAVSAIKWTPQNSITSAFVEKSTTCEEVNEVFKKAAKNQRWAKVLKVTEDPIVSSDIVGEPYGAIVDLSLTQVVGGDMVKVFAWYDNEFGYATRVGDLAHETRLQAGGLVELHALGRRDT